MAFTTWNGAQANIGDFALLGAESEEHCDFRKAAITGEPFDLIDGKYFVRVKPASREETLIPVGWIIGVVPYAQEMAEREQAKRAKQVVITRDEIQEFMQRAGRAAYDYYDDNVVRQWSFYDKMTGHSSVLQCAADYSWFCAFDHNGNKIGRVVYARIEG